MKHKKKKKTIRTQDGFIILEHAQIRGKERAHLGGKSIVRFVRKAYNDGIGIKEARGELKNYIIRKYKKYEKANNIRVYGHDIYVMKNKLVFTVLDLPEKYKCYWNEYSRMKKEELISE